MAERPRVIGFVFVCTGLAIAAALAVTYIFGSSILKLRSDTEARHQAIVTLGDLLSTMKDAETGQRGYLLTGDDAYLQPYEQARRTLADQLENGALQNPVLPPADQDVIADLIAKKLAKLEEAIDLRRSGGVEQALAVVRTNSGKMLMDELRERVAACQELLRSNVSADFERADQLTAIRDALFAIAGVVSLAVVVWAYVRVNSAFAERQAALHLKYGVAPR